jgi:hypothetical protein
MAELPSKDDAVSILAHAYLSLKGTYVIGVFQKNESNIWL